MIKIRYIGPAKLRYIEPYEWTPDNRYESEVDAELGASLIVYPHPGQWEIVGGQKITVADTKVIAERLGIKPSAVLELFSDASPTPPVSLKEIPGINPARIPELMAAGVGTVDAFAILSDDEAEGLARSTPFSRAQILEWRDAAKEIING